MYVECSRNTVCVVKIRTKSCAFYSLVPKARGQAPYLRDIEVLWGPPFIIFLGHSEGIAMICNFISYVFPFSFLTALQILSAVEHLKYVKIMNSFTIFHNSKQ